MVEPAAIEMKFQDISLEGMVFFLNGSDYHFVGPTMESRACVTLFFVIPQHQIRIRLHHVTFSSRKYICGLLFHFNTGRGCQTR